MRIYLLVCSVFLLIQPLSATKYTINNQGEWDAITFPLLPSDSICIVSTSAPIVSMSTMTSIQGVIINDGNLTMNSPSAFSVVMGGKIINNGTFTVGNVGLSIEGIFINTGTLVVSGAAIVIQPSGNLLNTGVINNNIDIRVNGNLSTCDPVGGTGTVGGTNTNVPIGTPCNDLNVNTINDQITDASCTCAGTALSAPAPIPTLSEWGLILLGMSLSIFGLVSIRQRVMQIS